MSWPLPEELDDAALEGLRFLETDLWDEATGALVRPFVFLDRDVPAVRKHGYLLATVVRKPAYVPQRP